MQTEPLDVLVTAPLLTLYQSPEPGSMPVDELLCGTAARLISRCGDRVLLQSVYRYSGWADMGGFVHDQQQTHRWLGRDRQLVAAPAVLLQTEPRYRSPGTLTLLRGSLVAATGKPADSWQPVQSAGGTHGYLRVKQLSPYPMGQGLAEWQLRCSLVALAQSYLGCSYRWGGRSPLGLDCSGLTSQVYLAHGCTIWRDAQLREGFDVQPIAREQLRPADLLYWQGHIGIYLGGGRYIHANATDGCVSVASLDPAAPDCRHDLAGSVVAYGSVPTLLAHPAG